MAVKETVQVVQDPRVQVAITQLELEGHGYLPVRPFREDIHLIAAALGAAFNVPNTHAVWAHFESMDPYHTTPYVEAFLRRPWAFGDGPLNESEARAWG